jgi:hypothetical protein
MSSYEFHQQLKTHAKFQFMDFFNAKFKADLNQEKGLIETGQTLKTLEEIKGLITWLSLHSNPWYYMDMLLTAKMENKTLEMQGVLQTFLLHSVWKKANDFHPRIPPELKIVNIQFKELAKIKDLLMTSLALQHPKWIADMLEFEAQYAEYDDFREVFSKRIEKNSNDEKKTKRKRRK